MDTKELNKIERDREDKLNQLMLALIIQMIFKKPVILVIVLSYGELSKENLKKIKQISLQQDE